MDKPIVAAFDFDGTITKRDTFIPFALFVVGLKKWLRVLIRLIPSAALFLFRAISRKELKERALTLFFKGMPYKDLQKQADEFAKELLPRFVKKKALKTLEWHQEQGHKIVIISASPELYLIPWARPLKIDNVIASRLEVDDGKKITGRLVGLNCRGAEKVRRLKELMGGEKNYELYAYGDSQGDRELLSFADHKFIRKI